MKLALALFLALITIACDPGVPVSPLAAAAREGDTARIAQLAKSGVDLNDHSGVNGWTPLMHAVHKNQPGSVRALINAGADVNATAGARGNDTALRLAELDGNQTIITMLREHGAQERAAN